MDRAIEVISFDLDGTLVDDAFDRAIWFQEIPARYAAKHGLALEEAKARVVAEYQALEGHPRWTDMGFWFDRFGLGDWREAAASRAHLIRLYPETLDVLGHLQARYTLILITQAEHKFYRLKLRVSGLGAYFQRIFAMPEHFRQLAKDAQAYEGVLARMGLAAGEMLHVGDHPVQDYEVPRSVGIAALLLDRQGRRRGAHVIHDLGELLSRPELQGGETKGMD